ncbi:hypothetical protein GCM10007108_11210 [Thermogymnomonas acidicola]|uniref:Transposase n=1 Tax=Thermogymnomonas acidicola TaxID=399579 RepID=A0AA37F9N5_9ARCH|nr:IS481 family transposase [Thermogymnomonas acidicola]GGM75031.1 hypothetical protein GCM10007108_11210 [Thermogymnomonas acidicola]
MLTSEDKKFIVESVRKGYRVVDLAKMFNVTPRRIQQILKEDLSGDRPQRRSSKLSEEDAREIDELWNNYKIGSRTIFYLLKSRGRRVSYYQVYNYMRTKNMIRGKVQKERAESEEEREPPLSTVYLDYHQTSIDHPYAVACIDLSTRKIVSMRESRKITKELVQEVLASLFEFAAKNGLKVGKIIMRSGVLTILYAATEIQSFIKANGVAEVEADKGGNRVHLSLSRLWQNYDRFRWGFNHSENFLYWYNNRPVISRFQNRVTTPNEIISSFLSSNQEEAGHMD